MRKYSQPRQRCRNGQDWPLAATLAGSVQIPNGTATWPTCSRRASAGSRATAVRPDPPGVRADLERAEGVLGGPLAPGGDPVIPERGAHGVVAEELFQGVHRRARIGVALSEGVPEGVGDHALARDRDRLAGAVALWPVEALERLPPRRASRAGGARCRSPWFRRGFQTGGGTARAARPGVSG